MNKPKSFSDVVGKVTAPIAAQLREAIFEDNVVDYNEMLDAVEFFDNDPEGHSKEAYQLFNDMAENRYLQDAESPGEISPDEADEIAELVLEDNDVNFAKAGMVVHLKSKSKNWPEALDAVYEAAQRRLEPTTA